MKQKTTIRTLTTCAMLVAIEVVLSRFLSIPTPIDKIGFDFAPMALAGMLFGPFWGCLVGLTADFIGAICFPIGAYFFGFTLTAGLSGLTYGLLLHKEEGFYRGNTLRLRTVLAVVIVVFGLQTLLNTYWLSLLYSKGYIYYFFSRMPSHIMMLFVQYLTIGVLSKLAPRLLGD